MSSPSRHGFNRAKAMWNEQADEYNQWDSLDLEEKVNWAIDVLKPKASKKVKESYKEFFKYALGIYEG